MAFADVAGLELSALADGTTPQAAQSATGIVAQTFTGWFHLKTYRNRGYKSLMIDVRNTGANPFTNMVIQTKADYAGVERIATEGNSKFISTESGGYASLSAGVNATIQQVDDGLNLDWIRFGVTGAGGLPVSCTIIVSVMP